MSKTWLVVRFTEENTVEMVPSNWYEKNICSCYWPPQILSKRDIKTALHNRKTPENDWKIYPAKVLGQYDEIKIAFKKAAKARDTDNLTSSASDVLSNKRKIKIRRYSSSSLSSISENEIDDYPPPPKKMTHTHQESDSPHSGSKKFQAQVMSQMLLINAKLDQHSENLAVLLQSKNNKSVDIKISVPKKIMDGMPLKDEADIIGVESYLNENEENVNALAIELSQIGGDTIKEITKRILYHTLTNKAGMLYSWEGAKGKKILKNLKLADIIQKAVRFNQRTKDAPTDVIVKVIKAWLVRCKDRNNNEKIKVAN